MSRLDLGRGARMGSGLIIDAAATAVAAAISAAASTRASYSRKSAECGRMMAAAGLARIFMLLPTGLRVV